MYTTRHPVNVFAVRLSRFGGTVSIFTGFFLPNNYHLLTSFTYYQRPAIFIAINAPIHDACSASALSAYRFDFGNDRDIVRPLNV